MISPGTKGTLRISETVWEGSAIRALSGRGLTVLRYYAPLQAYVVELDGFPDGFFADESEIEVSA